MSPQEQAQLLSEALQKTQARILEIERNLYTTNGNREELKRLKRVHRAIDRDLRKLVTTLPAPVQFSFFHLSEEGAPRVAAAQLEQKLSEEDRGGDTLPGGADGNSTLQSSVS